ncbi:MAG: rhodanese-like domain-containing protein [Leptospiraceae bacterium]|nr:rhodanese-like domain-containing protein [Leptospiraceae bacterium]MCB1202423.1 rhodanese-like domain-containing protein [Leptospiraceae bacterium]
MTFTFIVIAVVALLTLVFWSQNKNTASATEVKTMIDAKALVVDVRTPMEFQMGHFPGAVNIPVDAVMARIQEFGKDKAKPIVVYCASGARSGGAQRMLSQAGYTNVVNGGGLRQMMSLR